MKPHGTQTRYVGGCHCSDCREAHRVYAAELRADKAIREGRLPRAPGRPSHHDDVIDTLLEVLAGP